MNSTKFYIAVACAIILPTISLAWTGPTATPPNGNVSAPVNVAISDQFKPGILGANILNVYGSNQYINFGTTTGSTGFGFRNTGGILEYKQSAGQNTGAGWTEVGKGRGSTIHVALNYCGGPCGSYHAINTWVNVSGYGYTFATQVNTDPTTFTHNGTGLVTINKTGVYRIRMRNMMIPTTNRAWMSYVCPIINGSANCLENGTSGLDHGYYPAGSWGQESKEFTNELAAGTTVGYGYYIYDAMSYWGHDWYTNFSITRVN